MKPPLVVTAVIEAGAGVALLGFPSAAAGILLWPAVALHTAMEVWCIVCLMKNPPND